MGSLPRERLAHHMAPFTYTGVDYFGPIDIIVGRRHEKLWGVLFTCLTIRAVHLDIATSLSTDYFLCILKAFIAIRGCPRRMMSDNGTNFRDSITVNDIVVIADENGKRNSWPKGLWQMFTDREDSQYRVP
ncbi:uncharacterized protein LOC132797630 [Drosophila nasuta]|uniref:uncharacterized protein LOC132797630 n=1 Tax=Drosophila nasuta TaxID=42062 RepID=UPI00295EFC18|nr:uncharacterized protein LOC132797630 [Drosophila nasuta]